MPPPKAGLSNVALLKRFFTVLVEESANEPAVDFTDTFFLVVVLNTTEGSNMARLCWTLQFEEGKLVAYQNGENPTAVSTVEVHETTVSKLLSKEISPIKAFLQRLIKITGEQDAWRRLSIPAIKRTGLRLLPLLETQFPFPSYSSLEFIKRNSVKWNPDLPRCQICGVGFTLFNRKHHCRLCGKCVCHSCSPHTLISKRVCVFCFQQAAVSTGTKQIATPSEEDGEQEEETSEQEKPANTLVERIQARLVPTAATQLSDEERIAALNHQVRTNLVAIRALKSQLVLVQRQPLVTMLHEWVFHPTAWFAYGLLALAMYNASTSAFALYFCLSQLPQRPKLMFALAMLLAAQDNRQDVLQAAMLTLYTTAPIRASVATFAALVHLAFRLSQFSRLLDIYSTCLTIIFTYQAFKLFADRFISNDDTRDRWFSYLHTLVAPLALQRVLELKSVFVKFGQYLGARSDLMPKEWTALLERLQDDMPSTSLGRKSPYISRLLQSMGEDLVEFNPKPVASASIAQVHSGVWRGGQKVAIKIQHEGCAEIMKQDMIAFKRVMRLVCYLNPKFQLSLQLLCAWEKEMLRELDFTQEVSNLREISTALRPFPQCLVPQVLYSDELCFVMTWMDGFKITDLEQLVGVNRTEVLNTLISVYAHQVFVKGFFQADPHAGNLSINPQTNQLVLLDFGMCVRLTEEERMAYCKLLYGLGNLSVSTVSQAMQALGYKNSKSNEFPEQDLEYFAFLFRDTAATREESRAASAQFTSMRTKQQSLDTKRAGRHFEDFPDSLLFIMRTFGLLRGLCTSLGTSTSYMENMLEYAKYGLVLNSTKSQEQEPGEEEEEDDQREINSLEQAILEALDGVEGGVQVACFEHGAVLADVSFGTVSDCNAQPVKVSTLFPLLELTKVFEAITALRVLKPSQHQLLGPTIPSPLVYETLNHTQNGMEDAVHPSSFGHMLANKYDLLLDQVQTQAAGTTTPSSSANGAAARHTLSFGYELDLALKYNAPNNNKPTTLREEMSRFCTAELNYGVEAKPTQQFAELSHGYAKDIQEMMLMTGSSSKSSRSSSPLSLSNLPVLPGRIVPDAMMLNQFRRDNIHLPSIGGFASARAMCRFVYDAMKEIDFLKRVDVHRTREDAEESGEWGMGFLVHDEPLTGIRVFSHGSFGGSFFFCVPEKRLCFCMLVSHLQLDKLLTQKIVDLVCERSSVKSVPV